MMMLFFAAMASAACPAVLLFGDAASSVAPALSVRGVAVSPLQLEACAPTPVTVTSQAQGGLSVTVRLPDGPSDHRRVPTAEVAAAWITSTLRTDLFVDLVETEQDDSPTVRLYASLLALQADEPTQVIAAEVLEKPFKGRLGGPEGLPSMRVVDRRLREARQGIRAFAIEVEGVVYINDETPWPKRDVLYGRLDRYGSKAIYPQQHCSWVPATDSEPGFTTCQMAVKTVDLKTGQIDFVTPKMLKRVSEAAGVTVSEKRPKNLAGVWNAYTDYLEATEKGME